MADFIDTRSVPKRNEYDCWWDISAIWICKLVCSPKNIVTNSLAFHTEIYVISPSLRLWVGTWCPLSFFSSIPLLIIASLSTRRFCQHERQTGQIADEKSTSFPGSFISPPQRGKRGDDPGNNVEEKEGRRMWRDLIGSLSKDDSNGNDDIRK